MYFHKKISGCGAPPLELSLSGFSHLLLGRKDPPGVLLDADIGTLCPRGAACCPAVCGRAVEAPGSASLTVSNNPPAVGWK